MFKNIQLPAQSQNSPTKLVVWSFCAHSTVPPLYSSLLYMVVWTLFKFLFTEPLNRMMKQLKKITNVAVFRVKIKAWGLFIVQTTKIYIDYKNNFTIKHDLAALHIPCREELMWSQKEKKEERKMILSWYYWPIMGIRTIPSLT